MTAKNKNNLPGPLNKKGVRLWFWLMIIGPALILLYFFLFNSSSPTQQIEKYPLPSSPADIGSTLNLENGNYTVAPGKKIYITEELRLGNNTVAAEAGLNFIVVPLQLPGRAPDPAPKNWWLQDGKGIRYPLLRVAAVNPAINAGNDGEPGVAGEKFLIFKAPKKTAVFYVVFLRDKTTLTWKIK